MSPISESAPQNTEESGAKHFVSTVKCPSAGGLRLAQPRRVEWSQRETGKGGLV